uniref:Uncharacterized protein n=1 Tax=Timema bartmani TaxID=61472 RepID=A0A7R9F989_9NEOP|nr:unnamed protein product [Timema bartmani]
MLRVMERPAMRGGGSFYRRLEGLLHVDAANHFLSDAPSDGASGLEEESVKWTSALLDTHLKSLSGKLEEQEKLVKNRFVIMMEQLKTDLDKTETEIRWTTHSDTLVYSPGHSGPLQDMLVHSLGHAGPLTWTH